MDVQNGCPFVKFPNFVAPPLIGDASRLLAPTVGRASRHDAVFIVELRQGTRGRGRVFGPRLETSEKDIQSGKDWGQVFDPRVKRAAAIG